jgi:hypothetical protein
MTTDGRAYKTEKLIPILSQLNPVHTLTSYSFTINLNIILQSTPIQWVPGLFLRG